MKNLTVLLAVSLLCCVNGCSENTGPSTSTDFYGGFFNSDPVERAAGQYLPNEPNQRFDVGLAIDYVQGFDGKATESGDSSVAGLAFENDSTPVQVTLAQINGINLPWYAPSDSLEYWCNLYRFSAPALFNNSNSLSFNYAGFKGESFGATAEVAAPFGSFNYFDTISVSKGFHFHYQKPVPNDSIVVRIYGVDTGTIDVLWTLPDTGGFSVLPNQLLYIKNGMNEYLIQIHREHWSEIITPSGNRIGIYSRASTDEESFNTKP